MKRFSVFMMAAVVVALSFSLMGCGSKESQEASAPADSSSSVSVEEQTAESGSASEAPAAEAPASEEAAAPDDGQNPVMNLVGRYVCDRASMLIEAAGTNDAKITVTWSSSAAEHSEWVLVGTFDESTMTVEYTGGTRTDIVFNEKGDVESETVVYEDGTGRIVFQDLNSLTW